MPCYLEVDSVISFLSHASGLCDIQHQSKFAFTLHLRRESKGVDETIYSIPSLVFMPLSPVQKHTALVPTSTSPIGVPRESPVIYIRVQRPFQARPVHMARVIQQCNWFSDGFLAFHFDSSCYLICNFVRTPAGLRVLEFQSAAALYGPSTVGETTRLVAPLHCRASSVVFDSVFCDGVDI